VAGQVHYTPLSWNLLILSERTFGASDLLGLGRSTNYIEHYVRLGEHGDVAAVELIGGWRPYASQKKSAPDRDARFGLFSRRYVPAWLSTSMRFPRLSRRIDRCFGTPWVAPNELLLLLRKVSAEKLRALGTQPDTSIHDFDVGEDVGPSGSWTAASETSHQRPEQARRCKPARQRGRRLRHR